MKALRVAVMAAAAGCAAATALSWLNLRHLRRPDRATTDARISVLVPARDEADRIGPTLRSLRDQVGVHEVLILDDNSSDATADLVRSAGLGLICSTEDPPPGWHGKPWACQRLAQAASGDVLVFLDADVELTPDAAVRAAALLDDVDLVCPYPRQEVHGWLQQLTQPLLQWSWLTFLPLRLAERSTRPSLSAGNGQFLATTSRAYWQAGGHEAVRDDVLEDIGLVRAFKAAGLRTAMADGTDIATCRMYNDGRQMLDGYTKSLHAAFGPPVVALLNFLYVAPVIAMLGSRDRTTRLLGLSAYTAAVVGRLLVAGRTRQSLVATFAHPASIASVSAIYIRSVRAHRRGTITWRGRRL